MDIVVAIGASLQKKSLISLLILITNVLQTTTLARSVGLPVLLLPTTSKILGFFKGSRDDTVCMPQILIKICKLNRNYRFSSYSSESKDCNHAICVFCLAR